MITTMMTILRPNQHPRSLKEKKSQIDVKKVARSNIGYRQVSNQIGILGKYAERTTIPDYSLFLYL